MTFIAERLTDPLRILWSCIDVRCWESVVSARQLPRILWSLVNLMCAGKAFTPVVMSLISSASKINVERLKSPSCE